MKKLKRGRKVLARIRWWDKRDGNGIAYELDGTEFYIDVSSFKQKFEPKDGDFIFLRENLEVHDCRCGLDVVRVKASEATKSEFQIAATLRFGIAQMRSAVKQVNRLRKLRLAA